jgi:ABC-type uncharacterized transport system permease subunit
VGVFCYDDTASKSGYGSACLTPDLLTLAALICFVAGAVGAIAGFRVEWLRSSVYQFITAGAGVVLKTAAIGLSCATNQSHFFNSPSEMAGLLGWALACSYLVALAISAARSLGALILPPVVLLVGLSMVFSKEGGAPATIVGGSLLSIHILSAFLGYGLFLTACGASLLYLEQSRLLKRKTFGVLFKDLPSLERLERLETITVWLGFIVFTVALGTGERMASKLNMPFWLEPKVLATQVTWLVFGVLVVGRAARRLNGRRAAKCVLAGAALVLITFALSHPFARPVQAGTVIVDTFSCGVYRRSPEHPPQSPLSKGGGLRVRLRLIAGSPKVFSVGNDENKPVPWVNRSPLSSPLLRGEIDAAGAGAHS